jgi:zinc protease
MRHSKNFWLAGAVLLAFSFAGCTPAEGPSADAGIVEFQAAGIPVIYKPVEANDVIAVRAVLKGGSANLTPETQGIEAFVGMLLTRGTENYTKDEFAARAQATGTQIAGQALHDYSVATLQAVRDHWDVAWELFSEALLLPTFPEEEVELARGQILEGLRARVDDPDDYLEILANNLFYAGHPYEMDPQGTVESIEALTRDDLVAWHADRLTGENLVFVVVGNVDREDLEAKIADAFGSLPATGGTARAAPPAAPGVEALEIADREIPTNYIRGQFRAPSLDDPDYPAMQAAITTLSWRLLEEVRTKRNLSYAVGAGMSQRKANYGLLYVTAVDPDTTIKVMFHEVDRLQNETMTPEAVGEFINPYLTGYWMGQETNMEQASMLATYEVVGGGWKNSLDFQGKLRSVTPEDVRRVATEYIESYRFAVIGDPEKIDTELITAN